MEQYAATAELDIVREFYDAAISVTDLIDQRSGFVDLLTYTMEQGVSVVVVETSGRLSRALMVQELRLLVLGREGTRLIASDSPEMFTAQGDPMVDAVRQMLGVMAQLGKTVTVAKLRGARDRVSKQVGRRVDGGKGYDTINPEIVREAKRLARKSPKTGKAQSLREIAGEFHRLGYGTASGNPFSVGQVKRLLAYKVS